MGVSVDTPIKCVVSWIAKKLDDTKSHYYSVGQWQKNKLNFE